MKDGEHRLINYLRISVIDRCNFKCMYCMPEGALTYLQKEEILSFEEITTICKSMADLGITKIKITGGEPLVRKDIVELVRQINKVEGIEEITLTTNGILLDTYLDDLIEAGISSINISLDTLIPERFKAITKVDGFERVYEALIRAIHSPLKSVKVNTLLMRGINDDEICQIARLAQYESVDVRFIEMMPIGLGKEIMPIKKDEIKQTLEKELGLLIPYNGKRGNGPAQYWEIEGFKGKIGFISAVSECFCESCNRIRLTANGFLKLCLHYNKGIDLKSLIRSGISNEELTREIYHTIKHKPAHHDFGKEAEQIETKFMAQIGG